MFAAQKYDYGMPERGQSYEYYNFYEPLVAMGHDVVFLDLATVGGESGGADQALQQAVETVRPDLLFTFLFGEEVSPHAIKEVTTSGITTLNWFADDHWRFEQFSRHYAPAFSWVATTTSSALPKYEALGCHRVLKTQWATVPHFLPASAPTTTGRVSFVGQLYGDRGELVDALRRAGVPVSTRGAGWDVRRRHRIAARAPVVRSLGGRSWLARAQAKSRCTQEEMFTIFRSSAVNLNFTEASQGGEPQIKGRTFEVPGCGGFLLSGAARDLEHYYDVGKEIVVFHDRADLVAKVRHFLRHERERARIATAGYERTIAEHTYERRFHHLFTAMGL